MVALNPDEANRLDGIATDDGLPSKLREGPLYPTDRQRGRKPGWQWTTSGTAILLVLSIVVSWRAYGAEDEEEEPMGAGECKNTVTQDFRCHLQKLLRQLGPDVSVRTLIATVPDPEKTAFGAVFDAELAAIRAAFTAMGYVSGQHFLPWRPAEANTDGGNKSSEGGDSSGTEEGCKCCCPSVERPSSLGVPGILVFRKPTSSSPAEGNPDGPSTPAQWKPVADLRDVVLVLLVGETPVSGAFRNALVQALELAQALRNDKEQPIAILGPTFSGSAPALRAFLEEVVDGWHSSGVLCTAPKPPTRFVIVSGSATSPGVPKEFACKKRDPNSCYDSVIFDFSATVAPDDEQTCAMYSFLEQRLAIDMRNVAIMTESNTTFGAYFKASDGPCEDRKELRPRLVVPFPLHVSDLRNAEERRRRAGRTDAAKARAIAPEFLDLPLDQRQRDLDSLPAMAPELTAAEAQLVLSEQLTTLCRQNIQALGILATDIRDVAVLGEEARRRCPRLLLFTLGPDRMLHHLRYHALDGLLVASTYPLHAAVSQWTYPFPGRHLLETFPSESAQGMFNAALALMGDPSRMRDYGPPGPLRKIQRMRPAVWISAVGRDGFWPVQAVPTKDSTRKFVHRANASLLAEEAGREGWERRFRIPSGFLLLLALLLLFAAINLIAFVAQSNPQSPPSRRRSVWSWFDPYRPVDTPFAPTRGLAVASAFLVLALMSTGVALLFAIPGFVGEDPYMRLEAIGATLVVGLLLAAAISTLCCQPVWTQGMVDRRFLWAFCGGGLWLGLALSCLLPAIGGALAAYEPDLTLFFRRTTNLASGFSVTPGALLYALALFVAALAESARIRLLDLAGHFQKTFPLTNTGTSTGVLPARAVQTGVRGLLIVLVVAGFGILVSLRDYHHPFEGPWLGYLFCWAGPYLIAGMILFQLYRFVRTWGAMQRAFNDYLESHELPPFRNLVPPLLLRLLLPPMDPTLKQRLLEHCAPVAKLAADDPGRESVRLALLASYGRAHLHNQLASITGSGFMLIIMSTLYPFKLLHSIDILTWVVVLAIVLVAPLVLLDMNRNEVLSSIAGNNPGHSKLDRSLPRMLLVHVGVPLLGLAATRFASVGALFGDLVNPLIQLLGAIDSG